MNGDKYYCIALSTDEKKFENIQNTQFVQPIYIEEDKGNYTFRTGKSCFENINLLAMSHLILGAVTFSKESEKRMQTEVIGKLPIIITEHLKLAILKEGQSSASVFSAWAQLQLKNAVTRFATAVTSLQAALMTVRQEHEKMQLAFSSLEVYVANHMPPATSVSFSADLTPYYYPEEFKASLLCCTQLLPVSSQGFSGIELFFKKPLRQAAGKVQVIVEKRESEDLIGSWEVDFNELNEGWNQFALSETLSGPAESLMLTINWKPINSQQIPSIALSWHQPLDSYRIQVSNGESPPLRSLAFRCFSCVPGLKMPVLLDAFYPKKLAKEYSRAKYSKTFQDAVQIGHSGNSKSLVQSLDSDTRLLVHPSPDGVTVALLPTKCPKGNTRISAVVKTEHDDASDICYGVALVPKDASIQNISKIQENSKLITAFSGWHVVKSGVKSNIHLMTNAIAEEHQILLMTKLPPGSSTENAWATFHEIEFFSELKEVRSDS